MGSLNNHTFWQTLMLHSPCTVSSVFRKEQVWCFVNHQSQKETPFLMVPDKRKIDQICIPLAKVLNSQSSSHYHNAHFRPFILPFGMSRKHLSWRSCIWYNCLSLIETQLLLIHNALLHVWICIQSRSTHDLPHIVWAKWKAPRSQDNQHNNTNTHLDAWKSS